MGTKKERLRYHITILIHLGGYFGAVNENNIKEVFILSESTIIDSYVDTATLLMENKASYPYFTGITSRGFILVRQFC